MCTLIHWDFVFIFLYIMLAVFLLISLRVVNVVDSFYSVTVVAEWMAFYFLRGAFVLRGSLLYKLLILVGILLVSVIIQKFLLRVHKYNLYNVGTLEGDIEQLCRQRGKNCTIEKKNNEAVLVLEEPDWDTLLAINRLIRKKGRYDFFMWLLTAALAGIILYLKM